MRRFEQSYRIRPDDVVATKEDAVHRDVDLRLDALETQAGASEAAAQAVVDRGTRYIAEAIGQRLAEVAALLDVYRAGVPAASVQESDQRRFVSATFLDDLAGALAKRLRTDADQALGNAEKQRGRANLGLVIGEDVQAYDAGLAAIAGLQTQAFGRSLLTLASLGAAAVTPTGGTQASVASILVPLDASAPGFQGAFSNLIKAWVTALPTAPDGLPPGVAWKMGDAASGYTINVTGTLT